MTDDQLDQAPATPETPPEPDYKEIHATDMRELATPEPEAPKEETVDIVDKAADQAANDLAKADNKELVELGAEQIKAVADQAADAALERARVAEEAAKTPEENEYAKWERSLWEKENRQPTYTEALDFVSQQAEQRIEAKQAEKAKAAEEAQRVAQETQAAQQKQYDAIIDDELGELYNANKLTRIKDATNPSDQGVVERQALFSRWAEVNAERRAKGLPDILSATRIVEHYWTKPSAQPAGADAPVQGNRGSATPPSEEQEYNYNDIKKPWSFFRKS